MKLTLVIRAETDNKVEAQVIIDSVIEAVKEIPGIDVSATSAEELNTQNRVEPS